ncbi:MAG: hypothetical protein AB1938_28480 [Myxococcota bacterium]
MKRNGTVAPAAFLVATLPVLLGASSMSNSVVGSLNRVGDVPAEVRGAIILEVLGEATACLTLGLCASGALLLAAGLGAAVGSFGVRLSQRLTMRCLSGLAAFGGLWCVALASNAVARARTFVLFGAFRHRGCRSCCAKPSSRCSAAGR